jgi:hypothetical protein
MWNESTNKKPCENYLFEDYHLKSDIPIWIFALWTSGSTTQAMQAKWSKFL